MIAGAGLIVASVFINVRGFANLGANIGQIIGGQESGFNSNGQRGSSVKSQTAKSDIDQDGLFDEEEPLYRTDPLNPDTDGDGFLDGEEVAAGCNPTIPGLNDCSFNQKTGQLPKNITEYFSNLIFGGLLSDDLKKDNPNSSDYLSLLIDEALNTKTLLLSVDNPDLNEGPISFQTPQEFLNKLEVALKKYFFTEKNPQNLDPIDFRNFNFSPYINDLNQLSSELLKINPPQEWKNVHGKLTEFILKLETYFSNLGQQKEDPLKALMTLSHTELLLEDYEELVKEIKQKIKEQNLKSDIF